MLFCVSLFFFSSRRRHTRCALVTGVQTCALPIWVLAGVRLREDTPVRVDSTAATESQGITGGSYIQISAGTPSKPLLKEVSKETLPVIKAEKSSLQSLMDGGGALLADASQALDRKSTRLNSSH